MTTAAPAQLEFKEILVASDFSDASINAMNFAKAIARRYGSHILLAHISEAVVRVAIPEGGWVEDNSTALIAKQLEATGVALRAEGISTDTVNIYGPVKQGIEALAESHHAELIVVGTHSRKGIERLLFGSEAESLLRSVTCPVLTVGPQIGIAPKGAWAPKHILCATSLQPQSDGTVVLAYKLAQNLGATFTLLSVVEEEPDSTEVGWSNFERSLSGLLGDGKIDKRQIRHYGGVKRSAKEIADVAWKLEADLIVMGATPSSALASRLKRGIVPKVLADAPCPVLTLRTNR